MDYSWPVNGQHFSNNQSPPGLQMNRTPFNSQISEGKVRSSLLDLDLCHLKRAYGVSLEDPESSLYPEEGQNEEDLQKSEDEEDQEKSEDEEDQEIDWADDHHPLEFCESQIEEESDISSPQRDEREYKCSYCAFFGTKKELQNHNTDCHPKELLKNHWCPHCHMSFEDEISFKLHERQEHIHPCTLCKRNFKKERYLLAHLPVHSKEKCFKCPTCGKEFPTQRYLVRHMVRHEEKPIVSREMVEREKRSFKCTLCQKVFMKRESLAKHMRIHTRESLKCSQCDFSCEKKVILKMHVLTHEGNRKYKCAHCDFSFKQIGHLKRHIARFNH
uniref:C2H2-type domain-containing protein n=1 Tax=Graphocephala atropunctata TaxID=36148 RepID=A0A1B6KNP5_9HEMI